DRRRAGRRRGGRVATAPRRSGTWPRTAGPGRRSPGDLAPVPAAGVQFVPVVHAAGLRPARHLVVGRVRLEGQVRGGGDALQVAAGAVGLRVLADEFPEVGAVPGDEQVHEFVDEDVVDDPG